MDRNLTFDGIGSFGLETMLNTLISLMHERVIRESEQEPENRVLYRDLLLNLRGCSEMIIIFLEENNSVIDTRKIYTDWLRESKETISDLLAFRN